MSNTKYYAEYVLTGNTRGGLLVEDTIYINKALSGVGINTIYTGGNALAVVGNANVTGRVTAGSKSFLIDHPLKKKWKLMYGSLEGPEYAVYIRGTIQASGKTAVITLPSYWKNLVDMNTITVNLTPIGSFQMVYLKKIQGEKIYIASDSNSDINVTYWILAERKDIDKLLVEFKAK